MRKVRQAIDELGYTPNLSARHLRVGRTGIIALAIPELLLEMAGLPFDPALVASNDPMAIGAMRAVSDRGLRIPEDVAVVGFDDVEEGRFSNPTLTTISPDKEAIARLAVEMLVERIEGRAGQPPARDQQPPYTLIARESTQGRR